MLADAEAIRSLGIMEHPLALANAPGWELGQGSANLHFGLDGGFSQAGSALPAVSSPSLSTALLRNSA